MSSILPKFLPKRRQAPAPLYLSGVMRSHPGCVRPRNEDVAAYVLPRPDDAFARHGALALVADGLGGHRSGEIASRLAIDTIRRHFYEQDGAVPEILTAAFSAANLAIYERSRVDGRSTGMGTTCTAFAVRDGLIYLGHVGDSRAYLLRAGRLRQISQDHSVVAELVRGGVITAAEAARSPYRHAVLRALGTKPAVEPLIWREGMPLEPGDSIILCTDGLSDVLDDAAIAQIIGRLPPSDACESLMAAALERGGADNISLGVFAVGSGAPPEPMAATRQVVIDQAAGAAP
jgi:protein phosphatase